MNFIENGKEGRPALALIARAPRRIADPAKPGLGGEHNKITVPAGYVRAIRLIPQADAGGLRQVRRELLAIVGGDLGKGWRIAEGTATDGRGGAGRGQGRKPADGVCAVERKNVTLDAESIDTLRAYGDGDLSLGIRRAAGLVKSHD